MIPDPELGGFTARVPDVPAYGEGATEEAAIADLREALRGYIETFGPSSRDRQGTEDGSARGDCDPPLRSGLDKVSKANNAAPNLTGDGTDPPGPVLVDDDWGGACRIVAKAAVEPQAYFVTFTCYGTWLHGDAHGSTDRAHNEWLAPRLEPDEERERAEFARLKHSPVRLGPRQRTIAHHTIEEVCEHRGWRLHALNVRTNHIHVVVTANRRGKRVVIDFKSYATRRMKEADALPDACLEVHPTVVSEASSRGRGAEQAEPDFRVWTRGGSARPINSEISFRRAIQYTLDEQGPDITAK